MMHKRNGVSRRMVFIWCLLGGLICLFAPAGWTGRLQLAYARVFSWPLSAGRHLSLATAGMPALHATHSATDETWTVERQALKNYIANLEAQTAEAQMEIDELSRISAEPQWKRMAFLRADTRPSPIPDTLLINRGENDRVAVGQYVLGNMSIIGTISHVSARSATVRLITDENSAIPATIGESKLAGIVEGRARGLARIPLIPATHPVRRGDKVYAKKMPGVLDAPVVMATVTQCGPDPENPLLLNITVQPACDIATLTRVAVILSAPRPQ
ncbi:MAG: hypothetical protein A2Y77_15740 [Planctomycetes bacterium RBG_13_62_9]|nr:MAG: hypothetical protein A2Y77_15740 [Planctomycetes bacterium RBG_13_62_9]